MSTPAEGTLSRYGSDEDDGERGLEYDYVASKRFGKRVQFTKD